MLVNYPAMEWMSDVHGRVIRDLLTESRAHLEEAFAWIEEHF